MSQRALKELLRGQAAHADPVACVEDISAEVAARHIAGFPHSIGQLVSHMNYWMRYELRRIRDEGPCYPEHNAESFPPAPSPADAREWNLLRQDFAQLLADYASLAETSEQEMRREIPRASDADQKVAGTLAAVLWQMVAHNSYHAGQIALIRRALGAWPPKAGGDSW
jgi:uncharacterized damage-inducible protein DinB